MSNFQLSLIVIGALVLIVVIAYNTWVNKRNAPKLPEPEPGNFQPPEPGQRQEPVLSGAAPLDLDMDAIPVTLDLPLPAAERRGALDALIDAIAPIMAEHPVSGEAALAAMPPTRRVGSKPFAIEGLNDATQRWEVPQPGQRYSQFLAGIQLANRRGALNDIEFSEFVMKTQTFADQIGAAPDFPDMLKEVARARELDQFASDHDAQLNFMLRARQAAWSTGYIQQNAARQGFIAGPTPGRLVLPAASASLPPVLHLSYDVQTAMSDDPEHSALREVLLSLDVTLVHRTEAPFQRLRDVADALCQSMDAVLCDQHGQPLPSMAMDPIANDLEQLYDQLERHELAAGSSLARRLFS